MEWLLNWAWQGCAIVAAASLLLIGVRRLNAATRYGAWWGTLVLVVSLPVFPSATIDGVPITQAVAAGSSRAGLELPASPWWLVIALGVIWAIWVAVGSWRMVDALVSLGAAKRRCEGFPSDVEARLRQWMTVRATGRRATLVVSGDVACAGVFGGRRPMIAVAPSILRELTDEELDAVLLHEWAHVQRRDDLARLVQLSVRVMFGLHPAVWWIDRRLELERELATDDQAAMRVGSGKTYAACLIKLAELCARHDDPVLVQGAITRSTLSRRIASLLAPHRSDRTRLSLTAMAAIDICLLSIASLTANLGMIVTATPVLTASALPWIDGAAPAVLAAARPVVPGDALPAGLAIAFSADTNRARADAGGTPPSPQWAAIAITSNTNAGGGPSLSATTDEGLHAELIPSTTLAAATAVPRLRPTFPALSASPLPPLSPTPKSTSSPSPLGGSPWKTAADGGVAVGRASQQAAVATAGFFSRFAGKIAGAF